MRFVLVLVFLIIALGSENTFGQHGVYSIVRQDMSDCVRVLPRQKLARIFTKYMQDGQVQKILEYICSPDYKILTSEIESYPEYKDLIEYLESEGLPAKKWVEMLHETISIPIAFKASTNMGGLKAMCYEMSEVIDWHELNDCYEHKLDYSPHFHSFMSTLNEPEYKKLIDLIEYNPRVHSIRMQFILAGLDVDRWMNQIKTKLAMGRHH